jgi:plastocyanin
MSRSLRSAFPGTAALALLTGLLLGEGSALAATTWIVHVGRNGTNFVDDASATNVSTVQAGDTVTWVWEGTMEHSVTSGTCPDDHGGGGGGYGGYGGVAVTATCTESTEWETSGLHQGSGFTFSHTFPAAGTFNYFCAMHQSAMTGKVMVQPASVSGSCTPGEHTLCLNGGRFSATAHWTRPDNSEGEGTAVPLTGDSGYFWFFDPTNIEAIAKVLNGCGLTNSYWVFAAGLTNVAVHLTVTDTATGAVYVRDNAQGAAFSPVQDTAAFPSSCP